MADGARVRATPLRYAAFHGHARAVEELLAAGATPALRDPDRRQTALELARIGATAGGRMTVHGHGHAEVIRALEAAAAAPAAAAPAAAAASPPPATGYGGRWKVVGLVSNAELNGCAARVLSDGVNDRGRLLVAVTSAFGDEERILVKPEKLVREL